MYHVALKSKQQGEDGNENFKAIKNNPQTIRENQW